MFLMFGQQWTSTAQRQRSECHISTSGTNQPALRVNISTHVCVLMLSKGLVFVSIQKKHNAAFAFLSIQSVPQQSLVQTDKRNDAFSK